MDMTDTRIFTTTTTLAPVLVFARLSQPNWTLSRDIHNIPCASNFQCVQRLARHDDIDDATRQARIDNHVTAYSQHAAL